MTKIAIVVADGARARFFTLQPPDVLAPERSSELIEHSDLIHPEGDLPERELFSDREGRTHGSPHGSAHGSDDHRDQHRIELTRRFVRRMIDETRRFIAEQSIDRLVLAAEPRLLGVMRQELEQRPLRNVAVRDIAEDLSRRTPGDIQRILARHGLLPAASSPGAGVYHPRGQAPSPR